MNELYDLPFSITGKSNYVWILDAGHGGMSPKGVYTTAPSKMAKFTEFTVYEGVINRNIMLDVIEGLIDKGIDYIVVSDNWEDTPLSQRVNRADNIYMKHKNAVYVSIHSNAGGGSGFEIFTSPGQTKSDKIANVFCETYQKHFPTMKFRADKADGDADKEADFYVLRKTDCPAVLVENLFFDNLEEAKFLMSPEGQKAIADCIVDSIVCCEMLKPI